MLDVKKFDTLAITVLVVLGMFDGPRHFEMVRHTNLCFRDQDQCSFLVPGPEYCHKGGCI